MTSQQYAISEYPNVDEVYVKLNALVSQPLRPVRRKKMQEVLDYFNVQCARSKQLTDEAKKIYKERAATAECVNAQARNRGLLRMPVRGLAKVRCVVRLYALAHNLMRMAALAPQLVGLGTATSAMAATAA